MPLILRTIKGSPLTYQEMDDNLTLLYSQSSPAFPYTGSAEITGSLEVTGSLLGLKINNGIGSYFGTDYETIQIRKTNNIYTDSGIIFNSPYSNIYSGIVTEVGGEIISLGINADQIDNNITGSRYGGLFRFDTRPGEPYFSVIRKDPENNPYSDLIMDVSGNMGVSSTVTSNTRLTVKGSDATSNNYGLKINDISNNALLHVRNDGVILMNSLPTSSAGLPIGSIWVDGETLKIII